jgi:hypothetical protein
MGASLMEQRRVRDEGLRIVNLFGVGRTIHVLIARGSDGTTRTRHG